MENLFSRADKTICAVSTPPGHGGVAVVRVSGRNAVSITQKIAEFFPALPESHRVYYGFLTHPQTHQRIDEVLVSYFMQGRSFTNEDVCEISCHGNPLICDEILQALVMSGAVIADRGEFTFRAFMNGRIDLAQAESVLSLIESQSRAAKALALRQLEGHLSHDLDTIEAELIHLLAHIEADIDFSTENLETISRVNAGKSLNKIIFRILTFIRQYEQGRLLKEGVRVSFFGLPNVGKSSLFNSLLENDRAIVTDIPGTTRDVLEGHVMFEGMKFVLFDTAGVRKSTTDLVEQLGIEKTHAVSQKSDVVLFVTEAHRELLPEESEYLESCKGRKVIVVLNKSDLVQSDTGLIAKLGLLEGQFLVVTTSAQSPDARSIIFSAILNIAGVHLEVENMSVISQSRHYELLLLTQVHLEDALRLIDQGQGLELIALELKSALLKVQEILGKFYDDQVLDQIFKEFCLGK
jgi:tRNA modification GTPase